MSLGKADQKEGGNKRREIKIEREGVMSGGEGGFCVQEREGGSL